NDLHATRTRASLPASANTTGRESMNHGLTGRSMAPPGLGVLFASVFALAGWRAGLGQLSDNSFFCHLRTGQWMLEHGIPHRDLYSFVTVGAPWVCESWLAELLYGITDRFLGAGGLRLLTAL